MRLLCRLLRQHDINYVIIGGLAVAYQGRARMTRDVDLLLDIPAIRLPGLLDDLAAEGFKFDSRTLIRQWSRDHLTQIHFDRVAVDWLKPVLPVHRTILAHAIVVKDAGQSIRMASPEGLILLKLTAYRPEDQEDIKSILMAHAGRLDLGFVREHFSKLADRDDPRIVAFEEWVREIAEHPP